MLDKLKGGDLRSIGKSNEVAQKVLDNPDLFNEFFKGFFNTDPIIRARAVDTIEKISKINSEFIQKYKSELIYEIAPKSKQKEVRWHIAQLISYLKLNSKERNDSFALLLNWLDDPKEKSKIVKVFCIQALTDLATGDKYLEEIITPRLYKIISEGKGSPALKSRAKKLVKKLDLVY